MPGNSDSTSKEKNKSSKSVGISNSIYVNEKSITVGLVIACAGILCFACLKDNGDKAGKMSDDYFKKLSNKYTSQLVKRGKKLIDSAIKGVYEGIYPSLLNDILSSPF